MLLALDIDPNKLRAARQAKHLTAKKLARAVGVGYRYISAIQNGRARPSDELIERMAKALGVGVEEISMVPPDPILQRIIDRYHRMPVDLQAAAYAEFERLAAEAERREQQAGREADGQRVDGPRR